jgi:hypothetical protein
MMNGWHERRSTRGEERKEGSMEIDEEGNVNCCFLGLIALLYIKRRDDFVEGNFYCFIWSGVGFFYPQLYFF